VTDYGHPACQVLITGKKGSGKTTYWLERIQRHRARWKWVFDPDREASFRLGWQSVTAPNQLAWSAQNRVPVCFDSSAMFPGNRERGFEFFCLWCWNVAQGVAGAKLVAVDEVWRYVPARRPVPLSFSLLLEEGRKEQVDLFFVAQRPNYVHDSIRAGLTEIVTFRHTDRLPLSWLADDFDVEAVKALKVPGGKLSNAFDSA
jgi:hypothetical protein